MPKYLELKGQRLACNDVMPLGLFFDLAEAMDSGSDLKAVAAMSRTLTAIVAEEDRPRLKAILYDQKNVLTMDEMNAALGGVIPQYTARPTVPPSSSPSGPDETGGQSKRAFHWGVDKEGKPTSSKAGPSAAH